jgi:hypothetical protein
VASVHRAHFAHQANRARQRVTRRCGKRRALDEPQNGLVANQQFRGIDGLRVREAENNNNKTVLRGGFSA